MRDRYASLREGLVGAWIPSIRGDGLLLPDLSGQGNNGTLTNMDASDWVSGQYGRVLDFEDLNNVVRADSFAQSHLQMTKGAISAWINITSLNAIHGIYTANYSDSISRFEFLYDSRGGFRRFIVLISEDLNSLLDWRPNATLSGWTHVCVSQSGSSVGLYVNGAFTASTSSSVWASSQSTASNLPNKVGVGGHNTINQPLRGQLDDIRIYNRALSEPEIKLLSQEPGVGFKRSRRVFDFGRKPAYLPPTPPDYRTVRVKQTEHASLREGLVGAWCPSVAGEGYTLPDLSGQGNNGTLTNMGPEDWVSGQYGRALDFDGSNDYANVGSETGLQSLSNSKMSVSCFFRYASTSAPAVSLRIASKRKAALPSHGWILARTSSNAIVLAVVNTGGVSQSISNAISDTDWHHAIAVWDNTTGDAEIFIDGVNSTASQASAIGTADDSVGTLKIGSSFNLTAGQFWDGQLDDIRIYNRALSESEIKLLASRPGIGLKNDRKVFDFNRQTTYVPKVSPYFRTIKANKTEHASLREGLVGAWIPSVAGDGGNILPDLSRQSGDGTLINIEPEDWVSSQYGRVLDLKIGTTTNQRINLPKNFNFNRDFGISIWANKRQNDKYLLGFSTPNFIQLKSNTVVIRMSDTFHTLSNFSLSNSKLSHLFFSRKFGETLSLYKDGVLLDSIADLSKTFQVYYIGATLSSANYGYNGQIDDVRLYNRILSESEIKLLAREPGIGFKPRPKTFDFGKQPVLVAPEVAPDYRSVRVKQAEHSSLREGLVGAWCPSVAGEGYTLPDLSGQGNNGTLTNMGPEDWVSGQYGRALDFDGSNDRVLMTGPSLDQYDIGISISAWYKVDGANLNQYIISKDTLGIAVYINVGGPRFFVTGSTTANIGGGGEFGIDYRNDGIWHYCCAVWSSQGTISLISDNQLLSTSAPTSLITGADSYAIGGLSGGGQYFLGQLDDIRVYNRALSEPEIKLLASRPGIGLTSQRHTEYYAPPNRKRNNLLGNLF